jgi:hypothetical protein
MSDSATKAHFDYLNRITGWFGFWKLRWKPQLLTTSPREAYSAELTSTEGARSQPFVDAVFDVVRT